MDFLSQQWMERTAGGTFIFRSERAEEREARRHEEQKQRAMETLFSHIQAQLEKEEDQGILHPQIGNLSHALLLPILI